MISSSLANRCEIFIRVHSVEIDFNELPVIVQLFSVPAVRYYRWTAIMRLRREQMCEVRGNVRGDRNYLKSALFCSFICDNPLMPLLMRYYVATFLINVTSSNRKNKSSISKRSVF